MNEVWQLWDSAIPSDGIDSIHSIAKLHDEVTATVGGYDPSLNTSYRRSSIRWIDANKHQDLKQLLWWYFCHANKMSFGFDICHLDEIQYTTYDSSNLGTYDWHIDTSWANATAYDRKLTLVLQLSDPDSYEGGDFEIDSNHPQPDPAILRRQGSIIIFPSPLRHRLAPVTKGIRNSLVAWAEGPKFR